MVRRRNQQRGFTLIEMIVVISIIVILLSFAVPQYQQSIRRAREAVLRDDLFTMRSLIREYTLDKEKAPQSLQDLVTAGYLKLIPVDPMTNSNSTWVADQEDVLIAIDQQQTGINDVHSGSTGVGTDGTPYNTW